LNLQNRIKEDPTVDLTSLIDVVFLLLLFFMVSTTFEHQAVLKVDLPDASAVDAPVDLPERLELVIDASRPRDASPFCGNGNGCGSPTGLQ
jgi:biopolymer transport protein ExbD